MSYETFPCVLMDSQWWFHTLLRFFVRTGVQWYQGSKFEDLLPTLVCPCQELAVHHRNHIAFHHRKHWWPTKNQLWDQCLQTISCWTFCDRNQIIQENNQNLVQCRNQHPNLCHRLRFRRSHSVPSGSIQSLFFCIYSYLRKQHSTDNPILKQLILILSEA